MDKVLIPTHLFLPNRSWTAFRTHNAEMRFVLGAISIYYLHSSVNMVSCLWSLNIFSQVSLHSSDAWDTNYTLYALTPHRERVVSSSLLLSSNTTKWPQPRMSPLQSNSFSRHKISNVWIWSRRRNMDCISLSL